MSNKNENLGMCNKCKSIVPLTHHQENNREYLYKHCPECGLTKTLVSNDASQYKKKRDFMSDQHYESCNMSCKDCNHKNPNVVFIETTNRCNMNCPICITNVPSMGFQFEPRMEFFDRVFKHCSKLDPKPSIHLFGGEPTVREDIFEIIDLAKSYGLVTRLVTNGLKLADKEYAQRIIDSGVTVLISYDGLKQEMYAKLREHSTALELKLKALENLRAHKNGKVVLMTVIDKQMNADEITDFLKLCIDKPHIRGIYFIPLTQVWDDNRLVYDPDRTTQEDIEHLVDNTVGGGVDFVPMGSMEFNNLTKVFGIEVSFAGVHPNCESYTYLVPIGGKHVPLGHFLKHGYFSAVADLRILDKKLSKYTSKPLTISRKLWANVEATKILIKHLNFGAIMGAKGLSAFAKWMRFLAALISGKKFLEAFREHSVIKSPNGVLELMILPFEDDCTLESERLYSCASCFSYIDVKSDTVKSIPFCIWEKYKKVIMKEIAEKYNKKGYDRGLSREKKQDKDKECITLT